MKNLLKKFIEKNYRKYIKKFIEKDTEKFTRGVFDLVFVWREGAGLGRAWTGNLDVFEIDKIH